MSNILSFANGHPNEIKLLKIRIRQILYDRKISGTKSNETELRLLKKRLKELEPTAETGQSQMAGPSGPAYDTTGNQRLESKYVKVGEAWESEIAKLVKLLENNNNK
jgi:hypothetical protein